ncbi:MAG: GNAT family N-acetyltransferase [Desulfocucumaceae bacterium]
MGFLFAPLRPEDWQSCLDLYNYVYPVSMSVGYWLWLNAAGPAGPSIIETAWDGEQLIGFYGVVPLRLSLGGREIPGAVSGAAVTHPDYRYRGVFSALGISVYRRAAESGIKVVYGFPTEHSRYGFLSALGWDYVQKNRELACWGGRGGRPQQDTGSIRQTEFEGIDLNNLWVKMAGGIFRSRILAVRDRKYLDWRFNKHPENIYLIFSAGDVRDSGGYIVLRSTVRGGETYGDIVDIAAVDMQRFRLLAGHALLYFRDAGCVRLRLPEGSPLYSGAVGMGFRESGAVYYFGCKPLAGEGLCGREWHYTMADTGEL